MNETIVITIIVPFACGFVFGMLNTKVSELLDNALNDLTPKDFDNLWAYISSILLDYCDEE